MGASRHHVCIIFVLHCRLGLIFVSASQVHERSASSRHRCCTCIFRRAAQGRHLLANRSSHHPKTIDEAQELGIHVKMLTGDAVAIGKELARQLHLGTNIYDSERLIGGTMSGAEVRDFVEAADGFAEVFPEHKYQVGPSLNIPIPCREPC